MGEILRLRLRMTQGDKHSDPLRVAVAMGEVTVGVAAGAFGGEFNSGFRNARAQALCLCCGPKINPLSVDEGV